MKPYRCSLLVLVALLAFDANRSLAAEKLFDVVVYGGTPGGIASAVSASRLGRNVALVEYHDHIGGMATSGLGKSDIENRAMIGGLFKDFVARVLAATVEENCLRSIEQSVAPRKVAIAELQRILLSQGQVLKHTSKQ